MPNTLDHKSHEAFIREVKGVVLAQVSLSTLNGSRDRLANAKVVYGTGSPTLRGQCHYDKWRNGGDEPEALVEICAFGEENWVQLACTTIHELAHVAAGHAAGHGSQWRQAAQALGLRVPKASGQCYNLASLAPYLRQAIMGLALPVDGAPLSASVQGYQGFMGSNGFPVVKGWRRPCPSGIGVKGGRSRGKGSGSRLRKFTCACEPPVIVRASREVLDATCNVCGTVFKRPEPKVKAQAA